MNGNVLDDLLKVGTLVMVGIIGFFVRQLIAEHKRTREDIITVLTAQAVEQAKYASLVADIILLRKADEHINAKLTDAIERLIRIEAASNQLAREQRSTR